MSSLSGQLALVTGGAGFIGSHIVRGLLQAGARVRVLDDLSGGKSWDRLVEFGDPVERIQGSLLDTRLLDQAVTGVHVIFHLAAKVSVPQSVIDPIGYHEVDATGTLLLLEAAKHRGVSRFVYSSTSALYGDAPEQPKHESHRALPISPYGVAKYTGELYVGAYAKLHAMQTCSLRYFNVFGPGQDPKSQYGAAIPNIVSSILRDEPPVIYGDGEQTRDFCYVQNVVHANLLAAQADVNGQAVNIGTGQQISVNDVVRTANRLLGKNVAPRHDPPRPGDIRVSYADISEAKRLLGYEPLVNFEDGMAKSIEWYRKNV